MKIRLYNDSNNENKIEKFIAKRVSIFLLVMIIVCIVFFKSDKNIMLGLFLGTFSGLMKFFITAGTYRKILNTEMARQASFLVIIRFFTGMLGIIAILVVSIVTNLMLFAGVVTGILLVPLFITINSITEGIGLTHNNFE